MSKTGWIVIGAVLAAGLVIVSILGWMGNLDRESSSQTFTDVTELVFDLDNAPIEIVAGDGDTVVDMTISTGFGGSDVDLAQTGGTLRLTQSCPGFFLGWACSAEFEVSIPPGVSVSGGTSNGAIVLTGLDESANVATSNGAVSLENVSGEITVRTSNGAIVGEGLRSMAVEATTSNGLIEMVFDAPPETVLLDTSNGAVNVILPSDAPPVNLSTDTSNGDIVTEVRTDPGAAITIQIETSNGDISVVYAD